jgi:hypothetical protein
VIVLLEDGLPRKINKVAFLLYLIQLVKVNVVKRSGIVVVDVSRVGQGGLAHM